MKININDTVKVQLTEYGKREYIRAQTKYAYDQENHNRLEQYALEKIANRL